MPRKQFEPTERELQIVQELKEKGASDKEIASVLGISYSTFKKYKKSLFDLPIKKGAETRKEILLRAAEDGLLKLIKGGYVVETTIKSKDGVQVEKVEHTKYVQPHATSIIFALCNLARDNWQHINKIEPLKSIPQNAPIKIKWV